MITFLALTTYRKVFWGLFMGFSFCTRNPSMASEGFVDELLTHPLRQDPEGHILVMSSMHGHTV